MTTGEMSKVERFVAFLLIITLLAPAAADDPLVVELWPEGKSLADPYQPHPVLGHA